MTEYQVKLLERLKQKYLPVSMLAQQCEALRDAYREAIKRAESAEAQLNSKPMQENS